MRKLEAAADPAPQADDPRGRGRRRERRREGGLVQPRLARRPPPARHAAAAPRQAREAGLHRRRARAARLAAAAERPGGASHPRDRPRSTRPPSAFAPSGSASGPGRRCARAARGRAAAGPLRAELRMPGAADALVASHFPADQHQAEAARERLAFEELFLYQAALAARRGRRLESGRGPQLPPAGRAGRGWLDSLPFELTGDQARAIEEIDGDLGGPEPMQRLLMGEVGSGKTVVALYAMLRALEAGHQAALMAPTETLAEQHFRTLESLLAGDPVPLALLTSAHPAPRRAELLASPRRRRAGDRRRHPRPDRGDGRVRLARRRRRRRAAPLRGPPARRARPQGPRLAAAARPPHDRDPDPADPLAHRLRRSRDHRAAGAARRAAGRSGPRWSARKAGRAPTSSFASACGRAARPTSSAPW